MLPRFGTLHNKKVRAALYWAWKNRLDKLTSDDDSGGDAGDGTLLTLDFVNDYWSLSGAATTRAALLTGVNDADIGADGINIVWDDAATSRPKGTAAVLTMFNGLLTSGFTIISETYQPTEDHDSVGECLSLYGVDSDGDPVNFINTEHAPYLELMKDSYSEDIDIGHVGTVLASPPVHKAAITILKAVGDGTYRCAITRNGLAVGEFPEGDSGDSEMIDPHPLSYWMPTVARAEFGFSTYYGGGQNGAHLLRSIKIYPPKTDSELATLSALPAAMPDPVVVIDWANQEFQLEGVDVAESVIVTGVDQADVNGNGLLANLDGDLTPFNGPVEATASRPVATAATLALINDLLPTGFTAVIELYTHNTATFMTGAAPISIYSGTDTSAPDAYLAVDIFGSLYVEGGPYEDPDGYLTGSSNGDFPETPRIYQIALTIMKATDGSYRSAQSILGAAVGPDDDRDFKVRPHGLADIFPDGVGTVEFGFSTYWDYGTVGYRVRSYKIYPACTDAQLATLSTVTETPAAADDGTLLTIDWANQYFSINGAETTEAALVTGIDQADVDTDGIHVQVGGEDDLPDNSTRPVATSSVVTLFNSLTSTGFTAVFELTIPAAGNFNGTAGIALYDGVDTESPNQYLDVETNPAWYLDPEQDDSGPTYPDVYFYSGVNKVAVTVLADQGSGVYRSTYSYNGSVPGETIADDRDVFVSDYSLASAFPSGFGLIEFAFSTYYDYGTGQYPMRSVKIYSPLSDAEMAAATEISPPDGEFVATLSFPTTAAVGDPIDVTVGVNTSGPYYFNFNSANWPPGLTLHSDTGQIEGTFTTPGTYTNMQVRASNADGAFYRTPLFSITIT